MALKHLSTHDTEMDATRGCTVLPVMNCIVIYGKKDRKKAPQFYLFKIEDNKFKEVDSFRSTCNHDDTFELIPLKISGQEHLAAICFTCKRIDLYPLATKKGSVAFQDHDLEPYAMCAGADNKLYVHFFNNEVFELDYSKPKFSGLTRKFTADCDCMCYLPSPHNFLAVSDYMSESIKAFSLDTNQVVWQFDQKIDGKTLDPFGLLYSVRHDALLGADGDNKRLLVLDPKTGALMQTISLPELGDIEDLWFYDNSQTVVIHHLVESSSMISCFSISI